ncbi:MAG: response regulator [Euryarchaeota archaeon]|nr:response regulator [Euryarchaeota archaeon]
MVEKSSKRGSILVVDDEAGVCDVLQKILAQDGYDVSTATSGTRALTLMKKSPADLVLLDIKMPKMDGIETLRKLREFNKDAVVVILTAYGTLSTAREAMQLGAYDYITKPFDVEFVKTMVREGLEERNA